MLRQQGVENDEKRKFERMETQTCRQELSLMKIMIKQRIKARLSIEFSFDKIFTKLLTIITGEVVFELPWRIVLSSDTIFFGQGDKGYSRELFYAVTQFFWTGCQVL